MALTSKINLIYLSANKNAGGMLSGKKKAKALNAFSMQQSFFIGFFFLGLVWFGFHE